MSLEEYAPSLAAICAVDGVVVLVPGADEDGGIYNGCAAPRRPLRLVGPKQRAAAAVERADVPVRQEDGSGLYEG
eukprot:COSAG03_NODE_6006_length_1132_cov_1.051307_1_plen_75_part_00